MVTITIDGVSFEVEEGENLLHTCLQLGMDLPYFCWHPALGSVGACRQCAIKQFADEDDEQGKIVMACMTGVEDGMRISVADPEAVAFRAQVIEWLMENHPHDCPVCDEGGECHLQDMTVMTGHAYRRTRFPKRTYRNQYLGPFLNHEMNRCIQCYRCVRFYRHYAGGEDLDVFAAHDHVYFGRHEDGVLESPFSGNLVEVCPTGVFTDKTLKRHYTRKWDLQMAPSVCAHCGLGCNITAGERMGSLRRIVNRYHHEINGYFLCDRGRFGYEFVNSDRRLLEPVVAADGERSTVSGEEAVAEAARRLAGCDRILGIGSARASLETNFALRTLVGGDGFFVSLGPQQADAVRVVAEVLADGPAEIADLRRVEEADAVLVLGEDLINTAPRAGLAVRRGIERAAIGFVDSLGLPRWHDAAVRNALGDRRGTLFILTPAATKLDPLATAVRRGGPEDIARLGFTVARMLDLHAPGVDDLDEADQELAHHIADVLRSAHRPLIVAGTSLGSEAILRAAANICRALERHASVLLTVPEANSMGAALLGPRGLADALEAVNAGERVGIVVVEADIFRTSSALADALVAGAAEVVVLDHLRTPTVERAGVALPAATFAEAAGTLVNNEGRAQRSFAAMEPAGAVRSGWRWLQDLAVALEVMSEARWSALDDVLKSLAEEVPALAAAVDAAPSADVRLVGQKVPRQPLRRSGRTALHADVDVHEPRPPRDPDSALAFSMEGFAGHPPPALNPYFWAPGWNSIQSVNAFQEEIGGPLRGGDPGVRLITPDTSERPEYRDLPAWPQPRAAGELQLLPATHIFGSEELSALAPGVAELAPHPYVALNREDAEEAGLKEGSTARLTVGDVVLELPAALRSDLPRGLALVPVGVSGVPALELPAVAVLGREERS